MKKCIHLLSIPFLLAAMMVFAGCQPLVQEVDNDIINTESKLVVYGLISPQNELHIVEVTESLPAIREINGNNVDQFMPISTAIVTLMDGASSVILSYNDQDERYEVRNDDFPITAGTTYTLTVEGNGKSVSATCTIPELNTNWSYTLRETSRDGYTHEVAMTVNDIPGQDNYYRADALITRASGFVIEPGYWDENAYVSDGSNDGGSFTLRKSFYMDLDYIKDNYPGALLSMTWMTTDEGFYRYFRDLDTDYDDNPFEEPVITYSNVEGGLGVFAGYQVHQVEVELE
ncbi:MAG: DUF4249 domain-containing protein [Flammeovirgaceae bacterium]